ncbi:hypothetical protein MASR1M74_17750 [Lentimicrobium sp.]
MNKKLLFPLLLFAAGIVFIVLSFLNPGGASGGLDIKIQKSSLIMPAAHKVYSNPQALNGQYYLFKALITNNGNKTLERVTMKYRVPGYIEWTELGTLGKMIPGQSAVVACYPSFDEKITGKTTESMEKAEIVVEWAGASENDILEESFNFKILNRNDFAYTNVPADEIMGWSDMFGNSSLIACFVTPHDPVVKYYTQVVQEKVMKGESSGISGTAEGAVNFLLSLYEATRMSHMVYSSTKAVPQSLDDVSTLIQHVRLPREVISGNTGLCIELSTLYASVLSSVGLNPVIFFIPGHAYPGVRVNGQYFAIESTGIGGEGMGGIASAEDAFKHGMKSLEEFVKAMQAGDPRYSLVDINQVNAMGVTSMNLEDNDFLRKKVDEIAMKFSAGEQGRVNLSGPSAGGGGGGGGGGGNDNLASGTLTFSTPSGWQTYHSPAPGVPILTTQVVSPDQAVSISVYDIPSNSSQNAMQMVAQYFAQNNMQLEYQINGGRVTGNTYYPSYGTSFKWIARIAPVQGGYRLIAVGADSRYYDQYSGVINTVYKSIK